VLTPDPLLDTPWAVTASGPEPSYCQGLGVYMKGDCLESEQKLIDFVVQHRTINAAEELCDEGFYPP
jgi:hypothetical protein